MRYERDYLALCGHLALYLSGQMNPSQIATYVSDLRRTAGKLRRYYETACNRELNQAEQARVDELEAESRKVANALKSQVSFNRDPRGFSVRLIWTGPLRQPYNNMGGEDWGL